MLKKQTITGLMATLALSFSTYSAANAPLTKQEAEIRGLEISKQAKLRDTGWTDSTSDMLMLLRNKQGQESTREIKTKTLELLDDGDKSLTIFNKPRDVKGASFLSFSRGEHVGT